MSHTYKKKKVQIFISKLSNSLIVQSHSSDVKNTHKKIIVERKESSVRFLRHKISWDRKIASHKDVLKLPFVE